MLLHSFAQRHRLAEACKEATGLALRRYTRTADVVVRVLGCRRL
eukprot:COSAG02_NODE_51604_length_313_cov_0.714953_1_plen_43_part_10